MKGACAPMAKVLMGIGGHMHLRKVDAKRRGSEIHPYQPRHVLDIKYTYSVACSWFVHAMEMPRAVLTILPCPALVERTVRSHHFCTRRCY